MLSVSVDSCTLLPEPSGVKTISYLRMMPFLCSGGGGLQRSSREYGVMGDTWRLLGAADGAVCMCVVWINASQRNIKEKT